MKKCSGCGVFLQDVDANKEGYTKNIEKDLCERCFRIRNYSDYKIVVKDNEDYVKILKEVNKTSDLVVFVVDVFLMNQGLEMIKDYLKNPILLVSTKRDLLPFRINDQKLLSYMDQYKLKVVDKEVISSYKNYNFDVFGYYQDNNYLSIVTFYIREGLLFGKQ